MPTEHLVSNFNLLLQSVNTMRPKRAGKFITRVFLTSPPSQENFKIDPKDFPIDDDVNSAAGKSKTPAADEDDDNEANDDDQEEVAVKTKN